MSDLSMLCDEMKLCASLAEKDGRKINDFEWWSMIYDNLKTKSIADFKLTNKQVDRWMRLVSRSDIENVLDVAASRYEEQIKTLKESFPKSARAIENNAWFQVTYPGPKEFEPEQALEGKLLVYPKTYFTFVPETFGDGIQEEAINILERFPKFYDALRPLSRHGTIAIKLLSKFGLIALRTDSMVVHCSKSSMREPILHIARDVFDGSLARRISQTDFGFDLCYRDTNASHGQLVAKVIEARLKSRKEWWKMPKMNLLTYLTRQARYAARLSPEKVFPYIQDDPAFK